jgi:oligosaccharide repeat unit polymerase
MIYHFAFTICILGLTMCNYYIGRKNVMYPPFLYSAIWLAVLSLYFLLHVFPIIQMPVLGVYTLFLVVAGTAGFTAGGIVMRSQRFAHPLIEAEPKNSIAKRVLLFCSIALLPLYYMEIRSLSAAGGLDGFLMSARVALVERLNSGESGFGGPLNIIAPTFSVFVAFIFAIEARNLRKERIWLCTSAFISFIFCILTTGRAGFLKLLVGLVGIYILKTGRYSAGDAWKLIRWPLVAFLVLFTIFIPITKVNSDSDDLSQSMAQYTVGYAVLPLAAFDYVVHHPDEYKYQTNHTVSAFMPIWEALSGSHLPPLPPNPPDFLMVPLFANVYTVLYPYYLDYGIAGMVLAMFLFGAGQSWLFWRAMKGAPFYIFLYAISLYPLSMVAFDNTYTLFAHYLVEFLFVVVYCKVLRRIPRGVHSMELASP